MNQQQIIIRNPAVLRMTVEFVMRNTAGDFTVDDILEIYPSDIR